jgi:hypothetical protein
VTDRKRTLTGTPTDWQRRRGPRAVPPNRRHSRRIVKNSGALEWSSVWGRGTWPGAHDMQHGASWLLLLLLVDLMNDDHPHRTDG